MSKAKVWPIPTLDDEENADWLVRVAERRGVERSTSLRHLPGKHDQKKHAGDGAALPEGWTEYGTDPGFVKVGTPDGRLTVEARESEFAVDWEGTTEGGALKIDPEGAPARAREAVARTAAALDRLDRDNPAPHGVRARISAQLDTHVGGETRWGFDLGEPADMILNAGIYRSNPATWRRAITNGHNHGDPDDVVRSLVTHEYGHVLQRGAAERAGLNAGSPHVDARVKSVSSSRVNAAMNRAGAVEHPEVWEAMSRYSHTSAIEMYAEQFTSWAMRDVTRPTAVARALAEMEGWK